MLLWLYSSVMKQCQIIILIKRTPLQYFGVFSSVIVNVHVQRFVIEGTLVVSGIVLSTHEVDRE